MTKYHCNPEDVWGDEVWDQKVGKLIRQMPDWYALWHTDGMWYCGRNRRPPDFLTGFDSPYRALLDAKEKHGWRDAPNGD